MGTYEEEKNQAIHDLREMAHLEVINGREYQNFAAKHVGDQEYVDRKLEELTQARFQELKDKFSDVFVKRYAIQLRSFMEQVGSLGDDTDELIAAASKKAVESAEYTQFVKDHKAQTDLCEAELQRITNDKLMREIFASELSGDDLKLTLAIWDGDKLAEKVIRTHVALHGLTGANVNGAAVILESLLGPSYFDDKGKLKPQGQFSAAEIEVFEKNASLSRSQVLYYRQHGQFTAETIDLLRSKDLFTDDDLAKFAKNENLYC